MKETSCSYLGIDLFHLTTSSQVIAIMEPLTETERDQIAWHANKGFLDEEQANELLDNPVKARQWLDQELPEHVREEE